MSINNFLFSTILQNKHIKVLVTYGSQTGNVEASLDDFSSVLDKDPDNLTALS